MKKDRSVNRFRYFFADTWWRITWFVSAVVWCAALNAVLVTTDADPTWIGPLSVLPLLAFAADVIRRDHVMRRNESL